MTETIFRYLFDSVSFLVRMTTVSVAILLIFRSAAVRFLPLHIQNVFKPLNEITDKLVVPVRNLLPEKVCSPESDYAPLVSAIIVLLIGLGMQELLENFEKLSLN